MKRITGVADLDVQIRDGYHYRRYVSQDENPFNLLQIEVDGRHKRRRVRYGIRNYYVVHGDGTFTIEGERFGVKCRDHIVIMPGEAYEYEGVMELIEFNIPTDGKIEHEDLE